MSLLKTTALLGAASLLSQVSAHGIVQGIVAGGVWYSGYNPSFQYQNPPPVVAGWSIPEDQDRGFVSDYTSPDIICHKGATPGGAYVKVAAGDTVELQWTEWPESHHGPMLDYLASCGDDCTTVDKTKLLFNKIDEAGLVDGSTPPGHWASDDMIANNNSWVVTIPSTIAPGNYVLRHETIALHSAQNENGAQNYPQCVNLEVTGSGSNSLTTGTLGTKLYTAQDPGILINIYQKLTSYVIPGPKLIDGASSGSQPSGSASASASASATTAAASTTSGAASILPTGHFTNATATTSQSNSKSIAITATPTKPANVQTSPAETETETSETAAASNKEATTTAAASSEVEPTPTTATLTQTETATAPGNFAASSASQGQAQPTGTGSGSTDTTSPVSFSSTVTGRIGKPTKFVCYLEED
ncbi:hypothetical protein HRR83_001386 [Exophiala dermatitidis]|uniref:AA9 family lytic polysaccharide monooxygenase n=2 Tax=Exophiala dermatitidis TaxID=5970 RepID=H6C6J4_EXODN|nr:endoglucanase [Exophiala dermatitidis NIH/UT8656]KAJ4526197.1 hypothetical protein HRR74_001390 [Exophiala dermatitidis]EHY59340.1 endoglucanase [Exophiala dermatitidis NIH/UT8656]KAJ4526859.1 hypothetical protein HRR73_001656 [Exophiala dermatitidis]KAJ4532567.1 hypothetical protein HRR76_007558 [Exophiala dermatitidis]KAJ4546920.1 hypothetical protein HRR77_004459 [Exophiala dermatitidis]